MRPIRERMFLPPLLPLLTTSKTILVGSEKSLSMNLNLTGSLSLRERERERERVREGGGQSKSFC